MILSAEAVNKTAILGEAQADAYQMNTFLHRVNPQAPLYAELYLSIGKLYGIRGDLAFAQAIKETGYWRFGGSVRADQNNFAGLGAVSNQTQGASFPTPAEGIEAQIQHLYGYATKAPLPAGTRPVDPRWGILVQSGLRGTAPFWEDLNGKWAVPGQGYGQDIVALWQEMLKLPKAEEPVNWKQTAMRWLTSEGLITSEHDADSPVTWAEFGVVLSRFKAQMDKRA